MNGHSEGRIQILEVYIPPKPSLGEANLKVKTVIGYFGNDQRFFLKAVYIQSNFISKTENITMIILVDMNICIRYEYICMSMISLVIVWNICGSQNVEITWINKNIWMISLLMYCFVNLGNNGRGFRDISTYGADSWQLSYF